MSAFDPASDHQSRTWIHILGAFVVAALMSVALIMAPTCGRKMQARQIEAIQQGAQVDLQLILERETQFHKANGFYTTDLQALGIGPKRVLYKFGFVTPSAVVEGRTDLDPKRMNLDELRKANPKMEMIYSPVTQLEKIDFAKLSSYCMDCTATADKFKVIAAANLDSDPVLDVWTIDEKGNVSHVIDDFK